MLFSASSLYNLNSTTSEYFNTKKNDDNQKKLQNSTTLYIGNLSFYTLESKIYNLFSECGVVKRVIMGLNRNTKTPCGFCFVEYYLREDALNAINLLNNTKLESRIIRVDWDIGFEEGRQFGRGFAGGQKRDEFGKKVDPDRPNFGGNDRGRGNNNGYRGGYRGGSYNDRNKYERNYDRNNDKFTNKKRSRSEDEE